MLAPMAVSVVTVSSIILSLGSINCGGGLKNGAVGICALILGNDASNGPGDQWVDTTHPREAATNPSTQPEYPTKQQIRNLEKQNPQNTPDTLPHSYIYGKSFVRHQQEMVNSLVCDLRTRKQRSEGVA